MKEKVLVVDVDRLGELVTRDGLLALPLEYIKKPSSFTDVLSPARKLKEMKAAGR